MTVGLRARPRRHDPDDRCGEPRRREPERAGRRIVDHAAERIGELGERAHRVNAGAAQQLEVFADRYLGLRRPIIAVEIDLIGPERDEVAQIAAGARDRSAPCGTDVGAFGGSHARP